RLSVLVHHTTSPPSLPRTLDCLDKPPSPFERFLLPTGSIPIMLFDPFNSLAIHALKRRMLRILRAPRVSCRCAPRPMYPRLSRWLSFVKRREAWGSRIGFLSLRFLSSPTSTKAHFCRVFPIP